jgi:SAM-dependent methyltransferase
MAELTEHEKTIVDGWPPKGEDWHRRAVGGHWQRIGSLQRDFLVEHGLKPEHRLLDIGCGCLRGGVFLIEYLDAGHYYGIDRDEEMLKAAREIELPRHGLESKTPTLLRVDGFAMSIFPDPLRFDFMLAQSVFTHLDPPDIELCLRRVMRRLRRDGSFFATFNETDGVIVCGKPYPLMTHYPMSVFDEMTRKLGIEVEYIGDWGHPANPDCNQRMLRFHHGDAAAVQTDTDTDHKAPRPVERRAIASGGRRRGTIDDWELIWQEFLPWGDGTGTVLDAGCGEHHWECDDWRVARCDNSQIYDLPHRRLNADVKDVDLNEPWPYEDKAFGGVICADVIEHLENLWFFFREAMRVSRDFVIISTPFVESEFSRQLFMHNGHLWSFTPEAVTASHHITPIFMWQLRLVAQRSGWKLDREGFINIPFDAIPMADAVKPFINKQPTQRKVIVRFASPEAGRLVTPR